MSYKSFPKDVLTSYYHVCHRVRRNLEDSPDAHDRRSKENGLLPSEYV